MVLVGHSQGGLLTKLAITDTGDKLWRAVSDKPIDQLDLEATEREEIRKRFFPTPLPSVKRVIFIATPHRGSYRASAFLRNLAMRFIKMPPELISATMKALSRQNPWHLKPGYEKRVPSSLDDMSPTNPWLLTLAEIPVVPSVKAHSIIAIKGDDQPPAGGDGVVRYASAHVPYVESEFIVRSGHTCQQNPATIEEVRRILLEHLRSSPLPNPATLPQKPSEAAAKP
jgi:hypothetical protein